MAKLKKILAILVVAVILVGSAYYHLTTPKTPNLPQPPLKTLAAAHGIELGNFAIANYLDSGPYEAILSGQFNLALIDNTPNWYFTYGGLRPSPTTYNFGQMDEVANYAKAHNMAMQAHHLVWGEEKWLPAWLKNGNYPSAQLLDLIHSHINTVVGRYRGQIKEWSVINEAFTRGQHIYGLRDWWGDHIGNDSFISDAFIWAHQADPHAILLLNDFGNEVQNSVSDAMYNYVKTAKAQGVPIGGIGMQMHIGGDNPPSKQAVIANMQRFAALGVPTYVTEFDVNMSNVKAPDAVKDQKEATIYYDMMRACIESKACPSFSILGVTDKETWYNYFPSTPNARPLPFDKSYQPKPAFYSLRLALQRP